MDSAARAQADILRHKPADADDGLMRALFYAHCLHGMSKRQIDNLLNSCEAGEFGEEAAEVVSGGVSEQAFNGAIKVLTCMGLHMTGLDYCSEGGPAWLIQLLFEALKEADEQIPEPPGVSIIERHGSWKRDRMCQGIAAHTCEILGLPASNQQLVDVLCRFLQNSALREETLLFALSQPPEALRRHLEVLG